jgi:hypothetical protein
MPDSHPREPRMRSLEWLAQKFDVLDRHAFHPQPFEEEHFLGGSKLTLRPFPQ